MFTNAFLRFSTIQQLLHFYYYVIGVHLLHDQWAMPYTNEWCIFTVVIPVMIVFWRYLTTLKMYACAGVENLFIPKRQQIYQWTRSIPSKSKPLTTWLEPIFTVTNQSLSSLAQEMWRMVTSSPTPSSNWYPARTGELSSFSRIWEPRGMATLSKWSAAGQILRSKWMVITVLRWLPNAKQQLNDSIKVTGRTSKQAIPFR